MTVGQKIARTRIEAGLSQRALAKKSDLTSQAINQYEKEKRIPDLKSFIAICKSFETTLDSFIDGITM